MRRQANQPAQDSVDKSLDGVGRGAYYGHTLSVSRATAPERKARRQFRPGTCSHWKARVPGGHDTGPAMVVRMWRSVGERTLARGDGAEAARSLSAPELCTWRG